MKKFFQDMQQSDLRDYDLFVAVILSHGNLQGICGTDYSKATPENVLKVEDDVSNVMGGCSSLEGKPKIFFLQVCRGQNRQVVNKLKFSMKYPVRLTWKLLIRVGKT